MGLGAVGAGSCAHPSSPTGGGARPDRAEREADFKFMAAPGCDRAGMLVGGREDAWLLPFVAAELGREAAPHPHPCTARPPAPVSTRWISNYTVSSRLSGHRFKRSVTNDLLLRGPKNKPRLQVR